MGSYISYSFHWLSIMQFCTKVFRVDVVYVVEVVDVFDVYVVDVVDVVDVDVFYVYILLLFMSICFFVLGDAG